METTLKMSIIRGLAEEWLDMKDAGNTDTGCYEVARENLRSDYDSEIWELVDSEENTLELDFDDILNDNMDEIESLVNYYEYNRRAEA